MIRFNVPPLSLRRRWLFGIFQIPQEGDLRRDDRNFRRRENAKTEVSLSKSGEWCRRDRIFHSSSAPAC